MPHPPADAPPPAWTEADLARDPHAADDKADRVRAMFSAIAPRYDLNNRLLKEFTVRSIKKVDGVWQVKDMDIRTLTNGSLTRLVQESAPRTTSKQ